MTRVEMAVKYAWSFIGTPYRWGGDDPMAGFDCSGFVIEILQAVGKLPRKFDTTAAGLFQRFPRAGMAQPGNLAFWHGRDPDRIVHVEFCLDNNLAIGASGGGSDTVTVRDAMRRNAFIKVRPIRSRANVAGFVDPFTAV